MLPESSARQGSAGAASNSGTQVQKHASLPEDFEERDRAALTAFGRAASRLASDCTAL